MNAWFVVSRPPVNAGLYRHCCSIHARYDRTMKQIVSSQRQRGDLPQSDNREIDDADIALRNVTYQQYAAAGHVPSVAAIAAATGLCAGDVIAGWRRLHDQHALVLDGEALRMLNPFSLVRTSHRVATAGRFWYANCAWDAFGVCSALHTAGRIETRCPDCSASLVIDSDDDTDATRALVFHSLVPARRWWDDIVFT